MTREQLQNIFRQAYNPQTWQELLVTLFGATEVRQTPSQLTSDTNEKVEGFELGRLYTSDRYEIGLFAFEIKKGKSLKLNRVGLRSLVKSYIKYQVDAALVVYYDQEHWRLSFVCDLKDEKTAPKRFTYVFGNSDESYRTASAMLIKLSGDTKPTFKDIKEAFSVEKMSKEFFDGYKTRYNKFCGALGVTSKSNRDYVKKMMGRLVFLQFLQKKGWMNGDYNYMQNLFAKSPYQDDFLEEVLEPLFFHVLNTKESDRNHPKLKNLGDKINIPYLNGGLFEADENDKKRVSFDIKLFADLFDFFSHYNFTIDENDPNDAEVGIDPEMLGHIFENLLEDNKDKGAFYTPKEIVQYMCRQSLIEYLQSKLGKHAEIESFINTHDTGNRLDKKNFIAANAKEIERLLDEVKICDPAIGSGAFPMGILNEIFQAKMALDMTLDRAAVKKNIIQNSIYGVDIEQGAVDIARLRFWLSLVVDEDVPQPLPNLDYKIMCGNSLLNRYALDMPFEDVFKEYNKGKNESERMSLAKYKQLVTDYTNISNHTQKADFRKTIEDIKNAFRTELSRSEKEKFANLKGQIADLEAPMLFGERTKKEKEDLKKLKVKFVKKEQEQADILNNKLYEDAFEWRFEFPQLLDDGGNFIGFDIVIGNPPYLRIQGIRDTNPAFAEELVKQYKSATGSFDLYAMFAERGLQIINRSGVVNYIMPVKWTNAAFGKGLRNVVAENSSASKIINFGAYQVFNASTYTGLQWFKPNSNEMLYYELDRNLETNQELGEYLNSLSSNNAAKINADKLNKDAWVLTVGQTTDILHKLEQHPRRISDIFDKIFQGLATSKDDVYFLYKCRVDGDIVVGYSKYLEREVRIERGLVKPLLKGEDVHRYDNISTDRFVIFPYILSDGKANLYAEQQISELFPMGYSYLKECEDVLRNREKGRLMNDEFWYRYIYPKNLVLFDNEKLVAPDISLGGNFAYDVKGEFYQTTTIYGYIKKPHVKDSYKVLMALLNSRLCWWFLTNTGTTLANCYFRFKPDYINPFPVPEIIPFETEKAITTLVDYILVLKSSKYNDNTIKNDVVIRHFEEIIDAMIYELYFPEEFKQMEIVIARLVNRDFMRINSFELATNLNIIATSFNKLRDLDNEIRNNLKIINVKLETTLAPILNMSYNVGKDVQD